MSRFTQRASEEFFRALKLSPEAIAYAGRILSLDEEDFVLQTGFDEIYMGNRNSSFFRSPGDVARISVKCSREWYEQSLDVATAQVHEALRARKLNPAQLGTYCKNSFYLLNPFRWDVHIGHSNAPILSRAASEHELRPHSLDPSLLP